MSIVANGVFDNLSELTILLLVSVFSTMAHLPTLILRILPFRGMLTKKQNRQLAVSYGVGLCASFLMNLWIMKTGQFTIGFYKINLFGFCVLMGVVNIVIVKGHLKEHLFTFGLTAVVFWQIFALSAYFVNHIELDSVAYMVICESIVGLLLFLLLYLPIKKLMRDTVTPFLKIESSDYWNTIWFIPIAIFMSGIFSKELQEYTATLREVLCNQLLGVAAILLCRSIAKDYKSLQEKEKMNRQLELQKQYYRVLTQSVQNEREVRHNFKHQLSAIRQFLDTGNSEALRAYCDSLEGNLTDIAKIPYTKNAAADGVLYHYACIAKENNIRFDVCCSLDELSISDIDLCCLLGNALDNAVTACKAYEKERYVSVISEKREGMLFLTVDNSFDGILITSKEKNGRILSKKRDNEEGIGIYSMEQICKKYHGSSRFEAKQNHFEASFLLKL